MVLKSPSVLSFLSPRLGFGSNQKHPGPENPPQHWNSQPSITVHQGQHHLGEQHSDPFRLDKAVVVNPVRRHTNPIPPLLQPPAVVVPDGGVGESPKPARRSTARYSRSSFTGFFAFSSRRKSTHGPPIVQFQQEHLAPPNPVPGRWLPGRIQTEAHIINHSNLPSPLRTDEEDYYYSYCAPLTPTIQSSPASPQQDSTNAFSSKRLSLRQQEFIGNQELDSHTSSPVDYLPPHTQLSHPYAYSSPLSKSAFESDPTHSLQHVASEQMHPQPNGARTQSSPWLTHNRLPPSAASHDVSQSQPSLVRPPLKTSMSTPNLGSPSAPDHARLSGKKKPSQRSKAERLLSAETWWDALLSPSPRFKVKQAPRQDADVDGNTRTPAVAPVSVETKEDLGLSSPPVATARPRAASTASHTKPTRPTLTKSRSAADLLEHPSTSAFPRSGFEPELEPLADDPTPTPEHIPSGDAELALPELPPSLAQVIDEGEALDQQRAQWKLQASKSIGNKHTRSLSRARSKSLSERHVRGRQLSESSKSQSNLEFLAARTLLGSQSTMPTVNISKPSGSSSHSKPASHSHSQSGFSHTHTHTSHSNTYSHSHSHSLATSNSSKSSRNPTHRGHSRNESWGKTALLKAGALCGVGEDDSYVAPVDEKVPPSSKPDVDAMVHLGESVDADKSVDEANRKISPIPSVPGGEVGIAISSPPQSAGLPEHTMPDHPYSHPSQRMDEGEYAQDDNHRASRHTHKSSEYAGPHPSALDLNLPQHAIVNNVCMRHRFPPRAAVQLPIGPISHPYGSASAHSPPTPERRQRSGSTTLLVPGSRSGPEQSAERSFLPHISLSQSDFERYGVGEALVYASLPRPEDVLREKEVDSKRPSSPVVEPPSRAPSPRPFPVAPPPPPLPIEQHFPSLDTVVLTPEDPKSPTPSGLSDPASLSASTIQMVMSAFDNPDDLDEFQDLFYKPHLPTSDQQVAEQITLITQVPTDVHSSESKSPLENLVRSLSEEIHEMRNVSRTPSGSARLESSESRTDHPSSDGGTKYVFMDLAREYSSSPTPMELGTPTQVPIQKENEPAARPTASVPEDVTSSRASSMLGSTLEENENDTFGYPIWHGHSQAAIATPTPTAHRASLELHLSVVDTSMNTNMSQDGSESESTAPEQDDDVALLSPVRARFGLSSTATEAVRLSYMTTSDVSRMSGLSDFPLPPTARPGGHLGHVSILQAYFEEGSAEYDARGGRDRLISTGGSHSEDEDEDEEQDEDEDEDDGDWDRYRREGGTEEDTSVPRSAMQKASYESHRTTFGGSEDMDFITRLHNVGP